MLTANCCASLLSRCWGNGTTRIAWYVTLYSFQKFACYYYIAYQLASLLVSTWLAEEYQHVHMTLVVETDVNLIHSLTLDEVK